jgi:serine/threonine-protein kinase
LFSLGAVLYFMATGHPPFRAEQAMAVLHRICHDRHRPVYQINPTIPGELAIVIDQLLEKKPSRRTASANEAQAVLANVLNEMQHPRRWHPRRWLRGTKSRRFLLSAINGVALAALALIWLFPWRPSQEQRLTTAAEQSSRQATTHAAAVGDDASAATTQLPEFAHEVGAIDQSLKNIENRPFPETTSPRLRDDSWARDLNSIRQAVSALETSWPTGSDNSLPFSSSIGEKQ